MAGGVSAWRAGRYSRIWCLGEAEAPVLCLVGQHASSLHDSLLHAAED
jgi:hypothetical protein